ncbi:MAG: sigma-70 family RNA polymerase sigma factor [Lachnospiraceae bacterium]|nr:sigma-70 family RNA polymerase sigma factor [Lachnospiraceae bacterium]
MENVRVLELYDLYSENVYKLAYTYTGNKADSEDIVQNVFLKLLRPGIRIREGREKAYILSMTANACKDLLRSQKKLSDKNYDDLADNDASYELTAVENGLFNAVSSLPYKIRIVMYLFYYEGYSVKEIAGMLKISLSAVTMRLTRGREALKNILSQEEHHD